MSTYPRNSLSEFTTKLVTPVDLKDSWEVGLTEISFPCTVANITSTVAYRMMQGYSVNADGSVQPGHSIVVQLVYGCYNFVRKLLDHMSDRQVKELAKYEEIGLREWVQFEKLVTGFVYVLTKGPVPSALSLIEN